MMFPILMAHVAGSQVLPPQVVAVSHDFTCRMRTSDNKAIDLAGKTRVRVFTESTRGVLSVNVHSTDKKWGLLNGTADASFTQGPLSMKVVFNLSEGSSAATARKYRLELTFPAQAAEFHGAFGFAVLRDANDDTPLVIENRPDPIMAIGSCNVAPEVRAPQ